MAWIKYLIVVVAAAILAVGIGWALISQPYTNPNPSSSPSVTTPPPSGLPTASPSGSPTATNSPTNTSPSTTSSPTQGSPTPSSSVSPSPSTPASSTTPSSSPSSSTAPPATTAPPTQTPTPSTPTPTPPTTPVTATFNFDTGTPTLNVRTPTPIDQTSNGVTAHFSSPMDLPGSPAFSVQSHNSLLPTNINQNLFAANFLYPNTVNHDRLDIKFNQNIKNITITFATAEYHDPGPLGTGSTIRMTAYMGTTATQVGTPVTANGIEDTGSTYPEGTFTLDLGGTPFNLVEIDLPIPAQGATGIMIDNIIVTTV